MAWVVLMVDDPDGKKPATAEGAKVWKEEFGLHSVTVAADNSISMIPPGTGTFGTPAFNVVHPRDMTVVYTQQGAPGHDPKIEALAKEVAAMGE